MCTDEVAAYPKIFLEVLNQTKESLSQNRVFLPRSEKETSQIQVRSFSSFTLVEVRYESVLSLFWAEALL
jgi:hypothetical protein